MNRLGLASVFSLGWLVASTAGKAQPADPPPAAPVPQPPAPAAQPTPPPLPAPRPESPGVAPSSAAPSSAAPPTAATPPTSATRATQPQGEIDWERSLAEQERDEEPSDAPVEQDARQQSLHIQNTLWGSTGLFRVSEAGSGAQGTFRLALAAGFYNGSGVLCTSDSPCPVVETERANSPDNLSYASAHLGLSATILPFLEAYLGFHNRSTSNSRGRPGLLQALGDASLGIKGFTPPSPGSPFSFGGEMELWLLNGSGKVGLDGGGTSFLFRGIASLDASRLSDPQAQLPVRAHVNLAYRFNNSAQLVSDLERTPPPAGRGDRITRIERFGLNIDRVDFLEMGIGVEYVHPMVRPFLEWTLEAPVNRQDYVCNIDRAAARGDRCLGREGGFSSSPSRLTFGARVFPWQGRGLSGLLAMDIGTGATSNFIDEVAPELPWSFWLGVAYAIDTEPPKPVVVQAPAPKGPPPPPPQATIRGVVREKGTEVAVPNAILRYDGRPLTGMVADEQGTFQTGNLPPGTYTFSVTAPDYRDGQCSATIAREAEQRPPSTPAAPQAVPVPGGLPVPVTRPGVQAVEVVCELEALPRVGQIQGNLVDAETGAPVPNARVRITDRLARSLDLQGDASGQFRFENVPPGRVTVSVDAPGYLPTATEPSIEARQELKLRIALNKRPVVPNVQVIGKEVKLKKQVHFQNDSAEILPDSMALLEEIADVLKSRPEIGAVEVQGHTDNTGTPLYNQRLSQNRAQAVVDALVRLGVNQTRLTAKGYGQDRPLVPNVTDFNRSRNRRVQLMIQGQ